MPRFDKTCFGRFRQSEIKPDCSATETRWKIESSFVASLDMVLFNKRITKALIRLPWSAPLLFLNPRSQVFSHQGPDDTDKEYFDCEYLNKNDPGKVDPDKNESVNDNHNKNYHNKDSFTKT